MNNVITLLIIISNVVYANREYCLVEECIEDQNKCFGKEYIRIESVYGDVRIFLETIVGITSVIFLFSSGLLLIYICGGFSNKKK